MYEPIGMNNGRPSREAKMNIKLRPKLSSTTALPVLELIQVCLERWKLGVLELTSSADAGIEKDASINVDVLVLGPLKVPP